MRKEEEQLGQPLNHEIILQTYETNFSAYLLNKFLVSKDFKISSSEDKQAQDISQLAICVVANLIQRSQYVEAQIQIENCMALAQHYKLKPLEAKLMLLEITLTLQSKESLSISQCEDILKKLKIVQNLMTEANYLVQYKDAMAEILYLEARVENSINY